MLAITLALAGLTAAPAIAASVPIADGSVTWGFKASWRDYITRHGGTITTGDGVTLTDDGAFVWPVESGSYDDEGHRLELDLAGSVRFYAWDGQLDTTLRNLTLVLSEDASAIYADVNGENIDGETVALTQAPIAEIDLTGRIPTVDGGRTTWTEVPTALTADGSFAFSYAPGIALDPVTISYVGPGGKPDLGEHWIAPGWEVFTATAVAAFHRDEEHDHDATTAFADLATGTVDYLGALGDGSTTIRWVHKDLQTDQVLGSTGQITITQPAYDPDGKLLFSGQGGPASPIVAHRWNDETGSYDVRTVIEDINGGNLWFNRQARSLMISGLLNYVPWIGARSRWERDLRRARGGHGPGGTAHPRNGNRARDRVGVLSLQASLDCVSVLFGIARIGALAVPINARYKARELRYVVEHSGLMLHTSGTATGRTPSTHARTPAARPLPGMEVAQGRRRERLGG